MSGSRRLSANPIIVEVKPNNVPSIAPSTPPMAKAVRFPNNTSDLVTGVSRPLTREEAWSLYHFEQHAIQCSSCANPLDVFRRKQRLCDYGFDLAKDVAQHVYHHDGMYYSTRHQDDGTLESVEIRPEYVHVRSLLKALDQQSSASRRPPAIHYSTYPVTAPKIERRASTSGNNGSGPQIILEPSSSNSRNKPRNRARYATVVVNESPVRPSTPTTTTAAAAAAASKLERRGTLYEKDMQQRKEKAYHVEIREPENRRDRRRSGENRYYL